MKKLVLSLCLVLSLIIATTSTSFASKKITFRVGAGHVVENITWTGAIEKFFVPEVTEKAKELGYEIEWIKAYGGAVAKLGEALESVESGILDIAYVNYGFEPSNLKRHNMDFRIPFTCPDPVIVNNAVAALYEKYPEEFASVFSKRFNQTILGYGVTDNYCIYSTKPIKSVKDLEGMKIGGGGAYLAWLEGTGATPVQSSLNEGYTSLQTGVYDALITPLGASYGMKLHEVAPYIILVDFGAKMAGVLTMNNDKLNSLPDDLKQVVINAGKNFTIKEAKLTKEKYAGDKEGLKAAGATLIQFSDAAKEEWVKTIPNVVQKMVDEFSDSDHDQKEYVLYYWKQFDKQGYHLPVKWELN